MKTDVLKRLFCLICLLGAFSSCSDDDEKENPFQGTDNSILSFQLTQDGINYPGLLTTNQIEIVVAKNIVLEGATVSYTISEHASISPDPAKVKDWDESQEFTITSYNGATKKYQYKITRDAIASGGDVTLATQAEVDAFAATGISIINGSLTVGKETVGSEDAYITDISALSGLERIYYDLQLNPGYVGCDLNGLENLQQIGTLTIEDNLPELKEISLPSLQKINHQALTINHSSVEIIHFPGLQETGGLLLNVPLLKEMDFSSLTEIRGDISYRGNKNSEIESISFPVLKKIEGKFAISNWGNITSLAFPQLKTAGSLSFYYIPIAKLEFPLLTSCRDISINYSNEAPITLLSFPLLKETDKLLIGSYSSSSYFDIEQINFPELTEVKSNLTIESLKSSRLDGFNSLKIVGGKLSLSYLPLVEEIYFPSLKEIGETLSMMFNPLLPDVDGFSGLEKVSEVQILYCDNLASFAGLAQAFTLSLPVWNVSRCKYDPTAEDMAEGRYTQP